MSETLDLSEFDRLMGKLERLPADLAGALRPSADAVEAILRMIDEPTQKLRLIRSLLL